MPMQNANSNNTFIVSPTEWREAEKYFNENKTKIKFRRSRPGEGGGYQNKYSFIKVNKKIYAIANKQATGHSLGKGGYGYVKMALTEDGEKFAVKIESRSARAEDDAEKIVMNEIGFLKGELERELEEPKRIGPQTSKHKLYTIMPLILGTSLSAEMHKDAKMKDNNEKTRFSKMQVIIIASKICQAIQLLHNKRIIHGDIKLDNFMINVDNEVIAIEPVDYGMSLMLEPNSNVRKGTQYSHVHPAPEMWKNKEYSFASDVFSLGKMIEAEMPFLLEILDWNPNIIELIAKMQADEPKDRPPLDLIIDNIDKAAYLEAEISKLMSSFKFEDLIEFVNNNSSHLTLEMILQYAIKQEYVDIVKTIINWKTKDKQQTIDLKKALLFCIGKDRWNTEIIQAVINDLELKDLNQLLKVDLGQGSSRQRTLINLAINHNDAHLVKHLLQKKVSLSSNNVEFSTALDKRNPAVMQAFINVLDENALSTTKDYNGKTALMIAVKIGDLKIVQALIAAGVNLNEQDTSGNTALIDSAKIPNKEIALLLEAQMQAQKGKPLLSLLLENLRSNTKGSIKAHGLSDKKFIEIFPKIIDKIVEEKLYGSSLELATFKKLNHTSDAFKQMCSNLMFKYLENNQYEHASFLAQTKDINLNIEDDYGNTALSLILERLLSYKIKTPPKLELKLAERLMSITDFSYIKQKEKLEEIVMAERKYYFRRSREARKLFHKLAEQLEGHKPMFSKETVSVHLPKTIASSQKPNPKR